MPRTLVSITNRTIQGVTGVGGQSQGRHQRPLFRIGQDLENQTLWIARPGFDSSRLRRYLPSSYPEGEVTEGFKIAMLHRATPERLSFFSDAIFAVLITVLVLEPRPPESPTFKALLLLWPTWLSYAVSYLFIAIVWANHHYLMRYATEASSRLMWFNFAHLFSMSLLPLSTAWMAVSELAPQPVSFFPEVLRAEARREEVEARQQCAAWT
jgi:hypothetical protein